MIIKAKILNHLFIKIALCMLLPVSCIERLDFIGETDEGQLVIYGLFTDSDERHLVNISRTVNFGLPPKGVSNAEVTLLTESGVRIPYFNAGNGNYELWGIQAEAEESYALEVVLDENTYRSKFEKVPIYSAEDRLSFAFSTEAFTNNSNTPVFSVFAESILPEVSDPIYLRWQAEETYLWTRIWLPCTGLCPPPPPNCFISDIIEPNRINLFDASGTKTRSTTFKLGRRLVDNSFISTFYVTVRQLSINREAYEYWQKIKIVVNNQGSLFDIPPAPVFGNISNMDNPDEIVLGYFEVAKTRISRIKVTSADVPFFLNRPCEYIVGKPAENYSPECIKCEERALGKKWTTEAPEWWNRD
jgi:hypothetical protein